jgi:hypothetical protein|tara:strand:+ start:308 stop:523 length:216 start_codon:yes stop_codon:yes gene_type:complete
VPRNVAGDISNGASLHAGYQGILDLIKQKKNTSNKLRYIADKLSKKEEDSDDDFEGRSVFQEVDYADSKKA